MLKSKTSLVINAIINKENMAEVQSYLGKIMPVFETNGGKPVGRYKTIQKLTGNDASEMVAIIEFPSTEVINQMINGYEVIF